MTEPKRSPIAALLLWLDDRKAREPKTIDVSDVHEMLEAAIAAQVEADWTPVAQLPEACGWYLVWAPKVMVKAGRYFFDGTGFINTAQGQHAELITHWRELPEGPKP